MGSGASPPPQPIPASQVAQTQQGYNTQSGITSQAASEPQQQNQYGSVTSSVIGTGPGGVPIWGTNTNLNPTQQGLLNTQTGTQALAGQQGQNLLAGANYGSQSPTQAIGNESSGIQGGLMNQWLSSQAPWMQLQTTQLDTKLRNQGISPSPTANPTDPGTWGPYEQAMYGNTQAQQMGVAGAASQFQPQAFQEATTEFGLPLQYGLAMAQFGAPTSPTSALVQQPQLNVQPADYTGAVTQQENQQMQAYQIQQMQNAAMMSGLFGLAGNVGGGLLRNPGIFASAGGGGLSEAAQAGLDAGLAIV